MSILEKLKEIRETTEEIEKEIKEKYPSPVGYPKPPKGSPEEKEGSEEENEEKEEETETEE